MAEAKTKDAPRFDDADHALLGPSGADRWTICTPSARLEETFPDSSSTYADEGTLAHAIGALKVEKAAGLKSVERVGFEMLDLMRTPEWKAHHCPDMEQHTNDYCDYVMELYNIEKQSCPDAKLLVERKFDLRRYIPESFGTGDIVIIAEPRLTVLDLKYGKHKFVEVKENKQFGCYGLGALDEFEMAYDIDEVTLVVYQPRMDNIDSWTIGSEQLRTWGENFIKPRALLAFNGEGEYLPGDHCGFCRARPLCKALAEHNMRLAAYDFQNPDLLSDAEVSDILGAAAKFKNWIGAVEDYALAQALGGKKWPRYKLVTGRSNRAYGDRDAVAKKLVSLGWSEAVIYDRSLLTLTAMEKLVGAKKLEKALDGLIVKPQGKPALVPREDPRPEIGSAESAQTDFGNAAAEDLSAPNTVDGLMD